MFKGGITQYLSFENIKAFSMLQVEMYNMGAHKNSK